MVTIFHFFFYKQVTSVKIALLPKVSLAKRLLSNMN